ncbi:MAG: hypothetical protein OER97_05885 [Gammaproteobacteria bacterium]|nr:hypothetical protein [Gammaproteobacteria bacterium]
MNERSQNLLAEGILIVASILVAFAIDAWWEERQNRVEERRILESLRTEFQANVAYFPNFIEAHRRSVHYAKALNDAMKAAGPGGTFTFDTAQLAQVIQNRSTDPQTGALDAILQSGELRYISNSRIREALAHWPRLVVDATENEQLLRTQWGPMLHAALVKNVDISPIQDMDEACWANPMLEKCGASSITLIWDTEVIGYLSPVGGYAAEAARELELLLQEAEDVVALLDQELARQ